MELKHVADRSGRLSSFLRGELRMSSGLTNRLKWQQRLFVNGAAVHTDYPVVPGDVIVVLLDEPEPEYPAEDGQLQMIYEDDHLLAVDKPAGMLIHPSQVRNTGTLANLVAGYYQKTGQSCAFHPLTRLDRDTFGLVLLAKNAHIHHLLNKIRQQGGFTKIYHALVWDGPADDAGTIDAPIARLAPPSLLRYIHPDGKPSVTKYTVLERGETVSKLALEPVTGRTHQLRVHCAHMGFPILGDPQYGDEAYREKSARLGLTYQLLCAKELLFLHPITGQALRLTSQMDAQLPENPGIF